MKYWAGLHLGGDGEMLRHGAGGLQEEALRHMQARMDVPRLLDKTNADVN